MFDFAKIFAKLAVVVNADTVGKLFCFKKKKNSVKSNYKFNLEPVGNYCMRA